MIAKVLKTYVDGGGADDNIFMANANDEVTSFYIVLNTKNVRTPATKVSSRR